MRSATKADLYRAGKGLKAKASAGKDTKMGEAKSVAQNWDQRKTVAAGMDLSGIALCYCYRQNVAQNRGVSRHLGFCATSTQDFARHYDDVLSRKVNPLHGSQSHASSA
jgi:hypothetical protein